MNETISRTLDLIRNPDASIETLLALFGEDEAYIAGVLDAVNGECDWPGHEEQCSDAERRQYWRGYEHGVGLCHEEMEADAITAGTSVRCSCCGAVADVWASYPNRDLCLACEAVNEPAEPGDDPTTPAEAA
jgi:hypothetical protein